MRIAVYGSAVGKDERLASAAREIGKAIAASGNVLVNGACGGLPHEAAAAASQSGGKTLGFSPWASREEHVGGGWPADGLTSIIFTGAGKKGRNVLSVQASDAAIIIDGRIGTLNEFTIAYDEGKVIGVLKGSGGIADLIPEIIRASGKATAGKVIYDEDAAGLVKKVLASLPSGMRQKG